MLETREVEISPNTSKNENINTSSTINSTIKTLENNDQSITIKPKLQQSKFESYIINAYKKLIGFTEFNSEDKKVNKKDSKTKKEETERLNILECETELRKALEEIESINNISLNKNILDKTNRIYKKNKINLSLLLGEIYIKLMNKNNIFNRLNQKNNLDKNIIISFINEVININSLLKNTYLCIKYENSLFNFLENIIKEIAFDSEQLNEINVVLQEHKTKKQSIKLDVKNCKEFLESINKAFNQQNSLYGQYKVVLDNCEEIINLINGFDIKKVKEIENFVQFGILLVKLFFGKKCILSGDKINNDDNNKNFKKFDIKRFFDGIEDDNCENINIIFGEKFWVDYDNDIESMREKICRIIIKYVEKFINISNLLELQYILFILLKRIYFYYFEKYGKEIISLFIRNLINLCLFKDKVKINSAFQFMNELLNSKDEKDENLKELFKQKIEETKNNSDFNFNLETEITGNMEKIQNEVIYIEEPNLNLGFFTDVEIESGESLVLYVELSKEYGFIDFALDLKDYDINFSLNNVSEGKVIYQAKKLKSVKGLKLNLLFSKPGIFKFEFDNTYSWIRKKNLSYKINVFYPQNPNNIGKINH